MKDFKAIAHELNNWKAEDLDATPYINDKTDDMTLYIARKFLKQNIDLLPYVQQEFNWQDLEVIGKAIAYSLDVSKIAKKEYSSIKKELIMMDLQNKQN